MTAGGGEATDARRLNVESNGDNATKRALCGGRILHEKLRETVDFRLATARSTFLSLTEMGTYPE